MKLSLITITRNNLSGLRRTVESVVQQTMLRDVQYIIVDGESTDGTDEYLATLPGQFQVIKAKPQGVYNAVNIGISHATGDVIGLLNAGDTYSSPTILQTVFDVFAIDPSVGYLYGDIHFTNRTFTRSTRYYSGADCNLHTMLNGFAPPHPSLYLRRTVQTQIGLYDESFKLAGDYEIFLRLFGNAKIKGLYLPLDMVQMAPGGLSATWSNRIFKNNAEKARALRKNGCKVSWLRIYSHYYYILKSTLCRQKSSV